jgi:hypothetical protein
VTIVPLWWEMLTVGEAVGGGAGRLLEFSRKKFVLFSVAESYLMGLSILTWT